MKKDVEHWVISWQRKGIKYCMETVAENAGCLKRPGVF